MLFTDKLRAAQARANSWLCVGLDTDIAKIPAALRERDDAVVAFNRAIVEATGDVVCAYKPNLAFYLARGRAGMDALADTVAAIPRDIPVILDAKFGDIESSSQGYARFAFEVLGVDAVTVSPYLGADALAPFLAYEGRAIFVLAHTSNPSAQALQDAVVDGEPLYVRVARMAAALDGKAEAGLVVGATFPNQLRNVRQANPAAVFLIPGIGAQGGSLEETVAFGANAAGVGPVINASRSILYASGGDDYADAARAAAIKMRDEINLKRKT
ncbi:MAG: orotidine-5'-phosphate decarboxylase [Chloroflexi bacterium]|nr:orotidine-5'-phosphate decarboxylase [Chloroflexota bacterium]